MALSRDAKFWIAVAVVFIVIGILLDQYVGYSGRSKPSSIISPT